MKKRIIAIVLSIMMILAMPMSIAAAAPGVSRVDAGEIRYGSITLVAEGHGLPLTYVYVNGMTINTAVADELNEQLNAAGFPKMNYKKNAEGAEQCFFTVKADDSAALADMISVVESLNEDESMISATDVESPAIVTETISASDESAAETVGSGDAAGDKDSDENGGTDDSGVVVVANVSSSDTVVVGSETPSGSSAGVSASDDEVVESAEPDEFVTDFAVTTAAAVPQRECSLRKLSEGQLWVEGCNTFDEALRAAFPEFSFSEPTAAAIAMEMSSPNITYSDDRTSLTIDIFPEPVYVEHMIGGEKVQALMVSTVASRFTVRHLNLYGNINERYTAPTTTTAPTTAATTAPTTAATVATTTTTAPTTAETVAPLTTTATTITTVPTVAPLVPGSAGYVRTRSKRLRVRTGPGFGYSIIKLIPRHTRLTVINTDDPTWYKVRLEDGTEGYCYSYYIAYGTPED